MKKFTKIEPVEQGDCSCSPSLSLAGDQSLLREITKCSTIIDWEQHYEKLIYKRSNRRLKRGLGKLQALCNDLLTRSDSTLLNPVTDIGDSDELDEEDLEQHEDGPTQFENLTDTRDSDELDEEYVDQHEDGPTQFENLMDTGDSDELDEEDAEQHQNPLVQSDNLLAGLVQEGTDPELDEVSLEDHEVSAEMSRDFIKIRILCRCGAEQQLIVMGNECFLMISPNEDVSGEHHKLVWASKEENELLIGIDCSCGTGFLLKKSGSSLLYSLQ